MDAPKDGENTMKIAIAVDSSIGGRSNNEDRFAMTSSTGSVLLAVADGMGGHIDGEVAAQIAVDVLVQQFRDSACPLIDNPRHFLSAALADAHQAILDHAVVMRLSEVPSTTVVAVIVQDGHFYCAYAGDSRLYLLDKGNVLFRSKDHSHVQRLIDTGFLNEIDAAHHPARNRIYSCLGAVGELDISLIGPLPMEPGATILLCTDGLWNVMSDTELARIFQGKHAPQVLPGLMRVAEKRGGAQGDNITALALTLLPDDTLLDSRDGYLDITALPGLLPEDTIQNMILDHELCAGLPQTGGDHRD